ncbi:MAG: hypothetical protein AAGH41_04985 [Pseudomonadota bacterium]
MLRLLTKTTVLGMALSVLSAGCTPIERGPLIGEAGEVYEITVVSTSESERSDGSGSANSRYGFVETIIARERGGTVIEYDLPFGTSEQEREREWQFPARVLQGVDGSLSLLNADDLNARLETWLQAAEIDRSLCGTWFFTWNAFKVECDVETVLDTVAAVNVRHPTIGEGVMYKDPAAAVAGPLTATDTPETLRVVGSLNADGYRQDEAEGKRALAQILGVQPPTLEDAIAAQADDEITGSITTTFTLGEDGQVSSRVRRIEIAVTYPDGTFERRTTTETLTRRRVTAARREAD